MKNNKKDDFTKIKDFNILSETQDFFDITVSRSVPVFIILVSILILSIILWAISTKIDDVVRANAVLKPTEKILEVKCLVNGEVIQKNYTQNQIVKKGDLLLLINHDSEQIALQTIRNTLIQYETELEDYRKIINFFQNETLQNVTNIRVSKKTESYITDYSNFESRIKKLQVQINTEKSIPTTELFSSENIELENQLNQVKFDFSNWKIKKLIEINEIINSYENKIKKLELQQTEMQRIIDYATIYAPIDGKIDELITLNLGDYINNGTVFLRIIPNKYENLKAEIMLEPSKIEKLKLGQPVEFHFQEFPASYFSQLQGIISFIPSDITIHSNKPYLLIEADISEQYLLSNDGKKILLCSGLTAEAKIIITQDSVIKILLRKLNFIQ